MEYLQYDDPEDAKKPAVMQGMLVSCDPERKQRENEQQEKEKRGSVSFKKGEHKRHERGTKGA